MTNEQVSFHACWRQPETETRDAAILASRRWKSNDRKLSGVDGLRWYPSTSGLCQTDELTETVECVLLSSTLWFLKRPPDVSIRCIIIISRSKWVVNIRRFKRLSFKVRPIAHNSFDLLKHILFCNVKLASYWALNITKYAIVCDFKNSHKTSCGTLSFAANQKFDIIVVRLQIILKTK